MFCTQCGAAVGRNDRFCSSCGFSLADSADNSSVAASQLASRSSVASEKPVTTQLEGTAGHSGVSASQVGRSSVAPAKTVTGQLGGNAGHSGVAASQLAGGRSSVAPETVTTQPEGNPGDSGVGALQSAGKSSTAPEETASARLDSARTDPARSEQPSLGLDAQVRALAVKFNPKSSKTVLACAFGLMLAFFMPWVQLFGFGMSGYNLGRLGSYGNYAWIIPILAGATIVLSFSGANNRTIGAISGIVPLGAILYGLVRIAGEAGSSVANGVLEIAGHVLSIGAWLTIIFSVAIIVAALAQAPTVAAESGDS